MTQEEKTRREFLRTSSAAVAGAALGPLAAGGEKPADAARILNHNPRMGYRRLGKTGVLISEVSLGGHGAVAKPTPVDNRVAVLERAVELGINYVDTNITGECALYGAAMAKSAHAKRDKWIVGFASWPQKITPDGEKGLTKQGMIRSIEGRLKHYKTDRLDIWRPVGATWGPGQTRIATLLEVSRRALDLVVEVFEHVHKQGKVRFLGVSAHNPKVFRRVLNDYPQFAVILFPYLFLTKELGGESLLALAKKKDVGVIGIKPFGAGTTFGIRPRRIKGRVDPRAHVLVKQMLAEPRVAAVIPGVNIPEQLDENVKGSYERHKALSPKDKEALRQCTRNFYAHLTPEYHWLRGWERV